MSRSSSKEADAKILEEAQLVYGNVLRHLNTGESYTYQGMQQRQMHQVALIKETVRGKYQNLIRQTQSSELSGKNKVDATNMITKKAAPTRYQDAQDDAFPYQFESKFIYTKSVGKQRAAEHRISSPYNGVGSCVQNNTKFRV